MIQNLYKINSLKKKKIEQGLLFVEEQNQMEPVIDKVIVFGSSVRKDCTEESDIDLCLFSDFNSSNPVFYDVFAKLPIVMEDLCDIFVFQKLGDKMKNEILKKGVIVYERQDFQKNRQFTS